MAVPFFPATLLILLSLGLASSPDNKTDMDSSNNISLNSSCFSDMNLTLSEKQREELMGSISVVLVPVLYLIAFVLGLPANLVALWVLLFRTKKMPSTILLLNLTCCDLLLLATLPFRIVYYFSGNNWTFGEPFCRLVIGLFYGNTYGSVVCLALIAADRYVALVHPIAARTLRRRWTALYMSLFMWLAVAVAMVPLLATRQTYTLNNLCITTCHSVQPYDEVKHYFQPYFTTLFFICFLLPLLVVLFCYGAVVHTLVTAGRRYGHAVKVTVLIVVVFVVFLSPSNVILLLSFRVVKGAKKGDTDSDNYSLYIAYMISLALATYNNCLDPFIYYYVSEDFREKALRVLRCMSSASESSSGKQTSYSSGMSKSKVTLVSLSGPSEEGTGRHECES